MPKKRARAKAKSKTVKKTVTTTATLHEEKPKAVRKKAAPKIRRAKSEKLENQIIQNLIQLEKVNINMAEKFESLSNQISNLLALFEMSARTFAKSPAIQMVEKDKEFLEKIDRLLDQNKTIARGLTLMEGKMREKLYGPIVPQAEPKIPPRRGPPRF